MSDWEQAHIVEAFRFELGKVNRHYIRERVVGHLNHVDHRLASDVAAGIGVQPPEQEVVSNHGRSSPALSQANSRTDVVSTRQVAVLVADGVDGRHVQEVTQALEREGTICEILAAHDGVVSGSGGEQVQVTRAMFTVDSVLYDAVFVPGGESSTDALAQDGHAVHFITEAFKHGKPLAGLGSGVVLLADAELRGARMAGDGQGTVADSGVVTNTNPQAPVEEFVRAFVGAIAQHRHWDRVRQAVPA